MPTTGGGTTESSDEIDVGVLVTSEGVIGIGTEFVGGVEVAAIWVLMPEGICLPFSTGVFTGVGATKVDVETDAEGNGAMRLV